MKDPETRQAQMKGVREESWFDLLSCKFEMMASLRQDAYGHDSHRFGNPGLKFNITGIVLHKPQLEICKYKTFLVTQHDLADYVNIATL